MSELTEEQLESIRRDLRDGQKIAAVKKYKDLTKCSLLEAKNFVESLEPASDGSSRPNSELTLDSGLSDSEMDEVLDRLAAGQKLDAIKRYRNLTGKTLKQSKEEVETLMKHLDIEIEQGSGCGSAVILLAASTAFYWLT